MKYWVQIPKKKCLMRNLKSKLMEGVNDKSPVDAASFPLAQPKTSVEHVILQQDALPHPDY